MIPKGIEFWLFAWVRLWTLVQGLFCALLVGFDLGLSLNTFNLVSPSITLSFFLLPISVLNSSLESLLNSLMHLISNFLMIIFYFVYFVYKDIDFDDFNVSPGQ